MPRTRITRPAAAQTRCSRLKRGGRSGASGGRRSVETLTHLLQIGRQRGTEALSAAVDRVIEGQLVGVEERTFHGQSVAATVAGVPRHRVSDGRQMDPNLI